MSGKRAEDFGSVMYMVLVSYPVRVYMNGVNDPWSTDVLVGIMKHERKVERECSPLTREQEKEGEEQCFLAEQLGLLVVRAWR